MRGKGGALILVLVLLLQARSTFEKEEPRALQVHLSCTTDDKGRLPEPLVLAAGECVDAPLCGGVSFQLGGFRRPSSFSSSSAAAPSIGRRDSAFGVEASELWVLLYQQPGCEGEAYQKETQIHQCTTLGSCHFLVQPHFPSLHIASFLTSTLQR